MARNPRYGQLRGERITFKAGGAEYTGLVAGGAMKGTVKTGTNSSEWAATRKGS